MPVPARPIIDRFFNHVLPVSCGCWIWTGALTTPGYGKFGLHIDKKRKTHVIDTHIFSWMIHNRCDIPEGMCVCHKCDVKRCVNPEHLFLGTHKENSQDCIRKGRFSYKRATCENHGSAKLNWEKVDKIRYQYSTQPISQTDLARQYGVCQSVISAVLLHRTWKSSIPV